MNRSILLIICDFLLLSFLGLANFDNPKQPQQPEQLSLNTRKPSVQDDIISILEASLDSEREDRVNIEQEFNRVQSTLRDKQSTITLLEQTNKDLEKQFNEKSYYLDQLEQSQQEQENLYSKMLQEKAVTEERLKIAQTQLDQQKSSLSQAQKALDQIENEHQASSIQKAELKQQVRFYEKRLDETLQTLEEAKQKIQQLALEREEARQQALSVAQGVTTIAQTTEQILENQPLSSNQIYDTYKEGKIKLTISTTQNGFFGNYSETYELPTVITQYSNAYYAIIHGQDTPFSAQNIDNKVIIATAEIAYKDQTSKIDKFFFIAGSPQLIAFEVNPEAVERMHLPTIKPSSDPTHFSDAVLIDASTGKYEDVNIILDPEHALHVKIETLNATKREKKLKRNTGDMLFDRSGKLLGIMLNKKYAALLNQATHTHSVLLGQQFDSHQTDDVLQIQHLIYKHLPGELQ